MTTRRTFLKTAAAAAALTTRARATTPPPPLRQLDYPQIRLLPGPMLDQFNHNHQLFLNLSNDALLKPFRQFCGQLNVPGEDMGGWYTPSKLFDPPKNMTGYIPGHSFGQYLSGLSRAYAITGDKATQAKVHALVEGFAPTATSQFYEGYCLPCYTYEKTLGGLIDAHQFAHSPIALHVLDQATDAVSPYLPDHALTRAEMRARPHGPGWNEAFNWDEPYTLPENFYLAYKRGAGLRYRVLAQRFLQDKTLFTPLAEGQNVLPGEHAYSHVNALSSAMQAWLTDASEPHLRAAKNGFRFVQEQSYATGGWGAGESFKKPGTEQLADSLTHTHNTFECPCGAYGHFKITRYLLTATGDPTYGDSMEQVLYNTILGAKLIQPDGTSFYYSDYSSDATKFDYGQKWPCCSGTFPQLTADYGISTYFATPRGLAINLYTPSRVSWKQGGANLTLTQDTQYPLANEITLTLTTDRKATLPIQLRIPAWAGPATRVTINGKQPTTPQPGTWHTLDREWHNNDHIELTLDQPLRLTPLDPQHPNLVALSTGPLALFALLPAPTTLTRDQLLRATRPNPTQPEWQISTSTEPLRLRPYSAIEKEHYRLYHQI